MVDPNEDKGERDSMFGFRFSEVHEVRENPERVLFDAGYRVLKNEVAASNQSNVNESEHTLEECLSKCEEIINIGSMPIPENGIAELRKEIDNRRVAAGMPELTMLECGEIIKHFFDYMSRGDEMENFKNDMFAKYTADKATSAETAVNDEEIKKMSDVMDVDDKDEFCTLVRILRKHKDDRNSIRRKERIMALIRFYYADMTDEEIIDFIEKL